MNTSFEGAQDAEALSKRGEAKRRKGDLDGALADFDIAIELQPGLAAGYSGRGLVKQSKGDLDGALLDLNRALKLRPDWTGIKEMIKHVKRAKRAGAKAVPAGAPQSRGSIPATDKVVLLRAAFADELAWGALCQAIRLHDRECLLDLALIDDRVNDAISVKEVAALTGYKSVQGFALVADETALSKPEHPILVVDLRETPGRTFRVALGGLCDVVSNLSIGNMGFGEFASAAGREGIFRGFA
jgi:tetratricopeptide (TPR) repeat protein